MRQYISTFPETSYETPPARNSEKPERSMFIFELTSGMKLTKTKVALSIKLTASAASGWIGT